MIFDFSLCTYTSFVFQTFGDKLLEHLEEVKGAEVGMTINEYAKRVFYKGVFNEDVIKWLENEGF